MSSDRFNEEEPAQIITTDLYQAQDKIYIRRVKGFFRNIRVVGGIFLFAAYFGTLWFDWGNRQLVLFDLGARKFHVFGVTFWPQDFILLSWALIIAAFALFFVTVLAGRVWCGYTCPQSVWTWIFVFIEEKVEGKRNARIKLDKQATTFRKNFSKFIKHLLWLAVAAITAITFVGYFVPIKQLIPDLLQFKASGWTVFWVLFFTLATYGNAGWLREQVCFYMCPYARFQAVMFDKDTLIVSYDKQRGEPRGARKQGVAPADAGLGDCVDCELCVQVCPTGIDIRNGLQYECIGCAACIDACDSVMDQMGYDRGLVRYSTENALAGKPAKILRPRLVGYGAALLVMITVFTTVLVNRVPLELDIIRDRGALYQLTSSGLVQNTYLLKIANMSAETQDFRISVAGVDGLNFQTPKRIRVAGGTSATLPTRLTLPAELIEQPANKIWFTIASTSNGRLREQEESRFFAPFNNN